MTSRLVEQQMSEDFAGLNPITSNDDDEYIDESNSNLAPIASSANGRKLGKLKITDQLVASVEKVPVPNHILNTKIYAKLQRNQIFEVAPGEIHFAGFQVNVAEPNKRYSQTLHVINISDKVQRMTVLPPMTRNFDVFYVKQERLVPGFALDITVYFKPDEYKYYNDAIRIHTEDEENLFIPVHAYPIISNYDFPTKYSFPNLPVGKSITRVFNLRSTAPIEFEFLIEILEKHPAFNIEPLEGIIPYDRDVEIRVTFSPKEFSTAIMKIQLVVSQFNSKPIVCSFYGSSIPGLARDKYYSKYTKLGQIGAVANSQKPASLTPPSRLDIDDSSQQQQRDNEVSEYYEMPPPQKEKEAWKYVPKTEIGKDVAPKREQFVDFDGFRFPVRLDNPWAVGKVLNQSKGKVSMKELKSNKKSTLKLTAQAKEAIFLKKVNELEDEERRNQLKWQVKLGESIIDEQTRQEILASRAQAVYEYKLSIGVPFPEIELKRDKTIDVECRSVRDHTQLGKNDITFDPYKNQLWKLRLISLEKFVQSARKIIMRNRLIKVLASLKKFAQSWNEAVNETIDHDETNTNKLNIENYIDIYCKKLKGENLDELGSVKSIHVRNMGTSYFAQVDEFKEFHEQKARHCEKLESILKLDSLGAVAVKSIDFEVPHETPYIGLAIPVNYKLNSYRTLSESSYVPKFEQRWAKLRLGAEDELSHHQVVAKSVEKTTTTSKSEPTKVVASTSRENTVVSQQPKIVDLVPGKHLSEPIEYPPFHIFNPTPGIMSYQKTLPYSGVDLNFHLNPLPRFDRDQIYPTQRKFLDREDVIKGSNSWKKFPSQGLQSLANTPTLTDVWIPRWTNTFGTDLLPLETPPLLTGLPEDDKQDLANLDTDSSTQGSERDQSSSVEKKIYLTPEMVNAQFNIPSIFEVKEKNAREELQFPYGEKLPASNTSASLFGQVERDRREQELEYFLGKQNNAIGHKIQNRFVSVEKQYVQQQQSQQQQQQQQPVQSLTIIQEQQQQ